MYYAVNTTINTIVHVHAEGVARDSVRVWGVDLMHETWYGEETMAFDEFVGTLAEAITFATLRYDHPFKSNYVDLYDKGEPECDVPERYTDEVDNWDDPCHEAYLQDEQAAREAEAQASASELEAEGFTIEDVVDTYYFMYDDAYGCEHTFSFKASYGPAMQLAEELDGDGDHDCLTVYDSDLNPIYPLPF